MKTYSSRPKFNEADKIVLSLALRKKGLNAFAKSIDSRQPAQSAQADMDRNFSLPLMFVHVKGPFCIMT